MTGRVGNLSMAPSLCTSVLSVMYMRRQRIFTERVDNAWNGLPGKVVTAETGDKFKLELDRYLEVLEMEGSRDVGRILCLQREAPQHKPANQFR